MSDERDAAAYVAYLEERAGDLETQLAEVRELNERLRAEVSERRDRCYYLEAKLEAAREALK